jgi:hypothetical protein
MRLQICQHACHWKVSHHAAVNCISIRVIISIYVAASHLLWLCVHVVLLLVYLEMLLQQQCRRAVGASPDRSISREGLVQAILDMSIPCTGLLPLLRMDAKDLKKQVTLQIE